MKEIEANILTPEQLDRLWEIKCGRDTKKVLRNVSNAWEHVLKISDGERDTNFMLASIHKIHSLLKEDLKEKSFGFKLRKYLRRFAVSSLGLR